MNANLNPETVREFLDAFEEVFDRDWTYTKAMLVALRVPTPIIGKEGTFINPKVEDEVDDWGNRARLLEAYRALRKQLP